MTPHAQQRKRSHQSPALLHTLRGSRWVRSVSCYRITALYVIVSLVVIALLMTL